MEGISLTLFFFLFLKLNKEKKRGIDPWSIEECVQIGMSLVASPFRVERAHVHTLTRQAEDCPSSVITIS